MSSGSAPIKGVLSSETRHFRHARDVLVHCRDNPDVACTAEIRGLVTKTISMGKIHFFTLADVTGSIQVVCEQSSLDDGTWTLVRRVETRCRILATGLVSKTRKGELSVFATSISIIIPPDRAGIQLHNSFQNFDLTGRFFLARLRRRATEFFYNQEYEEYEPSFLSSAPDGSRIKPLSVVFQGWGTPAYLNTAPISQLLESVLVTGSTKVFSVGRCFSDAVRDGFTSAESMIACAVELGASYESILDLSIRSVNHIFDDITTKPQEVTLDLKSWERKQINLGQVDHPVSQPTIQTIILSDPDAKAPPIPLPTAFRLIVPPDIAVAEGHCQVLDKDITVSGVTLHLERMLKLIKEIVLFRLRKD